MAHFAKIDAQNIVTEVLVIDQAEINTGIWGEPASFIRTSYNTRGGIYYTPNTNDPDPDQSKAFRKNYAGIGYIWIPNGPTGEGFAPPKPYDSWVMDPSSYLWQAPVPYPPPESPPKCYIWEESVINWVEVPCAEQV